jgi:hypothetical protein
MCKKIASRRSKKIRSLVVPPRVPRRLVSTAICIAAAAVACKLAPPFPPDTTPEGAYARVALAIAEGRIADAFPYLEDEAQWAAHTVQKERATALARARATFPEGALRTIEADFAPEATARDGAEIFARAARARGWVGRLRRDLSGVARVEQDGDRATIVTARGSRYPMRRRRGGIWGLTLFTAELEAMAEKASRDRARIEDAAKDYEASGSAPVDASP